MIKGEQTFFDEYNNYWDISLIMIINLKNLIREKKIKFMKKIQIVKQIKQIFKN